MGILNKAANFLVDRVIKAVYSELEENIQYFALLFSLITLDSAIYVTNGDKLGKIFWLSLMFSLLIFLTVAVAFSIMVKVIKDNVNKSITLFEVVAFIEAKRKLKILESKGKSPELVVEEEKEKEKEKEERIKVSPKKSSKKSAKSKKREKKVEDVKEELEAQSSSDGENKEGKLKEVDEKEYEFEKYIKIAEDELFSIVDELYTEEERADAKDVIKDFLLLENGKYLIPFLKVVFEGYAKSKSANSLGYVPVNATEVEQALSQVPLRIHVLNVYRKAKELSEKRNLSGLQKKQLYVAALAHDVGKAVGESVLRNYTPAKHPEAGSIYLLSKFMQEWESHKNDFFKVGINDYFLKSIAELVKEHHKEPSSVTAEILKNADWLARAEEIKANSTIGEEDIRRLYSKAFGDVKSVDVNEVKEEVVKVYVEMISSVVENVLEKKKPQFFYNISSRKMQRNIDRFICEIEEESGRAYYFVADPDYLLKALLQKSLKLYEYANQIGYIGTGNRKKERILKILIAEALKERDITFVPEKYYSISAALDEEEVAAKMIETVFKNNAPLGFRVIPTLIFFDSVEQAEQFRKIMESFVEENKDSYYVGKVFFKEVDKVGFVPIKVEKE